MKRATALFCLAMTLPFAAPAAAQVLSAQPIEIDLADTGQEGSLLVVAAYQPDTSLAPRLFGNANAARVAVPAPQGSVAPSIILGRVDAGAEATFGITSLLPQTVQEVGFRHDDVATRVALRQSRPELFRQLVEEGHVDPPDDGALKVALQTELQRMNCYRSRIDGDWGPGSRGSVKSYFEKRKDKTWQDQKASVPLFREIILSDDVRCEAPVAAAVQGTPTKTTRTSTRTTTRKTTTQKKQPARAAPKRQTTNNPSTGLLGGGIGVFR